LELLGLVFPAEVLDRVPHPLAKPRHKNNLPTPSDVHEPFRRPCLHGRVYHTTRIGVRPPLVEETSSSPTISTKRDRG
ncbi:MAG: hypothetical protein M3522_09820, partial [Actinomycetota bacterium]|nr:hypothetical protein [Actinomycetota bacterium]